MRARRTTASPMVRWTAGLLVTSTSLAACSGSDNATPDGSAGGTDTAATAPSTSAVNDLEPLACEHTGPGTDYAVGPEQPYASIGDVPWATLTSGDSVRIFWRDEPYHEKFLIQGRGTEDAPIVVCGVAGPDGQLPVIDGEDATTSPDMNYATTEGQARGLIHVSLGGDDEYGYKPEHVVIQGLHIRNAAYTNEYTGSDGATVPYFENAAGIFIERGDNITVRGVELESNGNGLFVASGGDEQTRSHDIVLERSYVHDNGTPEVGQDQRHNIYTEADGMVFQYNEIGPLAPGALGAALKDRSTGTVVRYNRITGGSRSLDLVDAQDSSALAVEDPDYRTTLVYGNVIINDAAVHGPILSNMIHYGGDSGIPELNRKGTLYFVHNTVIIRADQDDAAGVGQYQTSVFDLDTDDETAVVENNVFYVRSATPGATPTELDWGRSAGTIELGTNWASPGSLDWRYPDDTTGTVTGSDQLLTNAENDPGFVDEPAGDLAPAAGSALVDAAGPLPEGLTALGLTVGEEHTGMGAAQLRPDDGAPDLGAFESVGTPQAAPSSTAM